MSLNGDRYMILDGWLSRAELTDDETLLTFHYPAGTLSIRWHELKPLFDDAVAGVLCEVLELAVRRERTGCG